MIAAILQQLFSVFSAMLKCQYPQKATGISHWPWELGGINPKIQWTNTTTAATAMNKIMYNDCLFYLDRKRNQHKILQILLVKYIKIYKNIAKQSRKCKLVKKFKNITNKQKYFV